MAADIVAIQLGLTEGDLYTLWAPRWRDAGDEWEGFLGKDEDLYAFASVADLVAFVRTSTDHDLADHPAWQELADGPAERCEPSDTRRFDLVGVPELLADDPTADSVARLNNTLAVAQSLGTVCELPAVTKFFNGNPVLTTLGGGPELFTGRDGQKRWDDIGALVLRSWDGVLDAIDAVVTVPEVDAEAAKRAETELAEAAERRAAAAEAGELDEDTEDSEDTEDTEDTEVVEAEAEAEAEAPAAPAATSDDVVLGSDADFWEKVGIDPVRIIAGAGTFYTLRCYYDDRPIFLGRNGRISVFGSERTLARYLADEHDHDLSDLATYDNIRTAATDGSLHVDVIDDNVYVLTGIADDLSDGAVDKDQFALAVELLRDVGDYSEDDTVDKLLKPDQPLGSYVAHLLDGGPKPTASQADAAKQWEKAETFVESRLRRE
ncbi:primosomal protein [Mycobacterium sp. MYCO198283]|uniref:primosomal protein n=1 Tax=Mycobacterium sp. MYCO198283 TaxID=2883505 RepID=UPI001E2B508D|nr:primosomal protein [Mycobacterium sp. MYCO198283]MCG5431705.1 primosomal protein [Mycobacterium sp. MYCO198283]